jgi:Calponin homology (CH) domain
MSDSKQGTPRSNNKVDRQLKDRKWEDVQQKAFTSWLNGYLDQREMPVEDVITDLDSGVALINFLELLLQKKVCVCVYAVAWKRAVSLTPDTSSPRAQVRSKWIKKPPSRIHKIQNLSIALDFLDKAVSFLSLFCSSPFRRAKTLVARTLFECTVSALKVGSSPPPFVVGARESCVYPR